MQLADNIVWISGLRSPTLLKNNDSWSLDAFGSSNQQAYIFFFNVLRVLDFSTSCHGPVCGSKSRRETQLETPVVDGGVEMAMH